MYFNMFEYISNYNLLIVYYLKAFTRIYTHSQILRYFEIKLFAYLMVK